MRTIKAPFGFIAKFLAEREAGLEEPSLAAATKPLRSSICSWAASFFTFWP